MATKREIARRKYIDSLTSPDAITDMCSKLSDYLDIEVTEESEPIKKWKKMAEEAGAYFDRSYWNMRKVYMSPQERKAIEAFEHPEILT